MRRSDLLRLAFCNAVGFSASTVMPLWIGGIADYFGVPAWFAGLAVVAQLGSAALFNLIAPWLFRAMSPARLARTCLLTATVAYGLATVDLAQTFILACAVSGAALGTLLNVSNRLLGGSDHVQHNYAVFVLIEVSLATCLFLGGSTLITYFGLQSLFPLVSVLTLTAAAIFPYRRANETSQSAAGHGLHPIALLALFSMGLFFIGQAAVNGLMPIIGQAAGLSPTWAGRTVAMGMLFGFVGAIAAHLLGDRLPARAAIGAIALLLSATGVAITAAPSPLLFALAMMAIAFSTMFSVPYLFAQLSTLDPSGRCASFGPAMILTGTAVGPSIAVILKASFGLVVVGGFSSLLLLLGAAGFWLTSRFGSAGRVADPV